MLLTGTFARSLDDKLRVAIPKRLREALKADQNRGLYIAPGTDKSLAIYAEDSFTRLGERLSQASPARHEVRTFGRLFYARARRVELDSQGRLRIPSELVALAGLEKEVVLLGVQDRLEIWPAERWSAYLTEKQDKYDEIAEAAFQ